MAILKWIPDYLLGVEELDNHHRHLFDLLNKSYDIFVAAEEILMTKNDFLGLQQHHGLRLTFCQRINEIQRGHLHGRTELSLEILLFLKTGL